LIAAYRCKDNGLFFCFFAREHHSQSIWKRNRGEQKSQGPGVMVFDGAWQRFIPGKSQADAKCSEGRFQNYFILFPLKCGFSPDWYIPGGFPEQILD